MTSGTEFPQLETDSVSARRRALLPGQRWRVATHRFHVERWLSTATRLAHLAGAVLMVSHATVLLDHLERRGLADESVALLCGNVAAVYRYQGDITKAEELWRREITLLENGPDETNELLVVQANLSLLDAFLTNPRESSLITSEAMPRLGQVYLFAQGVAADYPAAAKKLAVMAVSVLADAQTGELHDPRFAELYQLFAELSDRLEPTTYSDATQRLRQASIALADPDRAAEAEQLCRQALTTVLDGQPEVEARRLLVESLALQAKWSDADAELARFKHIFGSEIVLHDSVAKLVNNVGLVCAMRHLIQHDGDAASLLTSMLDWQVVTLAEPALPAGIQGRLRFLRAIVELHAGQHEKAHRHLRDLHPDCFDDGNPSEVVGWAMLLAAAQSASAGA